MVRAEGEVNPPGMLILMLGGRRCSPWIFRDGLGHGDFEKRDSNGKTVVEMTGQRQQGELAKALVHHHGEMILAH